MNSAEEHGFITHQLTRDDQHRQWYTAATQQSAGYWTNTVDGSQLINMESAFLPVQNIYDNVPKNFLVYR